MQGFLARWATVPRRPDGALKDEPSGVQLLIVQTFVEDPTYLLREYITSSHFRRQADAAGWDPKPCRAP